MNYRLSRLAKIIIVISAILAVVALAFHSYNIYRIYETEQIIEETMAEKNVVKKTAIILLEQEGVDLYLGKELTAYVGFCSAIFGLSTLYLYSRHDSFFLAFLTAFTNVFVSFIGGLLLFYVILSGKSVSSKRSGKVSLRNDWERFIHKNVKDLEKK